MSIPRDRYLRMVRARYMSLLSLYQDSELEDGISQIRQIHSGVADFDFTDRFAFLLGRAGGCCTNCAAPALSPPARGTPGCCASWTCARPCTRGWPDEADLALPIEVVTEDSAATEPSMLRVAGGKGELAPTASEGRLTLTRGQFADWYAGGYRSATAAALAGVSGDPSSIAQLLLATADREPWLPDHF